MSSSVQDAQAASLPDSDDVPIHNMAGGPIAGDGAGNGGSPGTGVGSSGDNAGNQFDQLRPWSRFCDEASPEEAIAAYLKTCDIPPNWNE